MKNTILSALAAAAVLALSGCGGGEDADSPAALAAKAAVAYENALRDLDRDALLSLTVPEEAGRITKMFEIMGGKAKALAAANAGTTFEAKTAEVRDGRARVTVKKNPGGSEHALVLMLVDGRWLVKFGGPAA